ncbi:MAG: DUF1565 domain-containing protein, partial [Deltaproteobacteria bacterium]|nr:DUF1565 domain-containing protein [Deltaproteobacteria bacterium]
MRLTRELVLIAACAAWLVACGDDTSGPPWDAGVDDGAADGGDGGFVVAAPAAPTAPGPLTRPCPSGFTATSDGDCDPFPGGVLECGAGELQAPGEDACTRLGPACPAAGDWATDLPVVGTVRFVRAGATAGGDGSRGAPYPTIGEASRASGTGDVIAVAAGTYDEAVVLRAGVVLHGACTTGTVIAPTFGAAASLTATGLGAIARNVTLSGRG